MLAPDAQRGRSPSCPLLLLLLFPCCPQINAQHLLRYLAAAVVLNRKRRNNLRDLIKLITQEAYEYSDPITQVGHKRGGG